MSKTTAVSETVGSVAALRPGRESFARLKGAGDKLHGTVGIIAKALADLSMFVVLAMVLIVAADVVLRRLAISVPGLTEAEELLMVVVTFATVAYVGAIKGHIFVDLFISKLAPPFRAVIDVFDGLLSLGLISVFTWRTGAYAAANLSRVSEIARLPVGWVLLLIAVGLGLLALVVLSDILRDLSRALQSSPRWALVLALFVAIAIFTFPIWFRVFDVNRVVVGLLGLVFMVVLIFAGLPIAYSMALAGFLGMSYFGSWRSGLDTAGSLPYLVTSDFLLTVVPFFVLMGALTAFSGIGRALFNAGEKLMGRFPGGLAMATVGGCAAFGAVCGDSIATSVTIGSIALPEMKKRRYSDSLATGVVAAAGTLGSMIPPSIAFIFYAIVAEQSVGKLFAAGILPGIVIAALMVAVIYVQAKRNPAIAPPGEPTTWREKLVAFGGIWGMVVLFILVIGGIYGGFFTPVEGGAVGAIGAFVFGIGNRLLTRKQFAESLAGAARLCGMVLVILVGVNILGSFLALSRVPLVMADFFQGLAVNRWIVFAMITLMYIVFGMVMNIIAALLLTLPIILPTLTSLGFDLIWFGVISVLLVMIGQISPPVAIVAYATKGIAPDVALGTVFKGVLIFWATFVFALILLALFPQIALFLPNLMSR